MEVVHTCLNVRYWSKNLCSTVLTHMKNTNKQNQAPGRTRQSPQVAKILTTMQPDRTIEQTPIIHSENVVQQSSRDTKSDSELETWSIDRAITEVFRQLPQELCPKQMEENTPAKPLSGTEPAGT